MIQNKYEFVKKEKVKEFKKLVKEQKLPCKIKISKQYNVYYRNLWYCNLCILIIEYKSLNEQVICNIPIKNIIEKIKGFGEFYDKYHK